MFGTVARSLSPRAGRVRAPVHAYHPRMRALLCRSLEDGVDGLRVEDVASPALPPGAVRIDVRAAGVNFADTLLVRGRYQEQPALPFAPGLEAAGVVTEVAAGVERPQLGDRVLALLDHGGFASEAIARAEDVARLPDAMDFATAAAMPVTYATAHLALVERARLQAAETLVVFGATGGAGLAAVEVGKALGAHVVAVASTAEKLAVAAERGADECIAYGSEDVRERLEALGGPHVVFDPVGGAMFEAALHSVRPGGRILVIGFASGSVPQIPANHLLVKDASALGLSLGQLRRHQPEAVRAALDDLLRMWGDGALRPLVSERVSLDEAPEALRRIAGGRAVGKLVVDLGAE